MCGPNHVFLYSKCLITIYLVLLRHGQLSQKQLALA
jgi:hypothetical protein